LGRQLKEAFDIDRDIFLIFSVITLAYFSIPIFLIMKLAKFKSLGEVKKIIISVLIIVVFFLVTTGLLIFVGNEIDKSMIAHYY